MLTPGGICPRCGSDMMNVTSWRDKYQQFMCTGCPYECKGSPVDPEHVAASKQAAKRIVKELRKS